MTSIKLKPWIGKDYLSGGIFNKRIMVIFHSLLCYEKLNEHEQSVFTSEVVNDYLYEVEKTNGDGRIFRSFFNFENSLMSMRPNKMQRIAIWNSLLFYSYNQKLVCQKGNEPEQNDYAVNERAFFEVIEQYRPDYIVVWGRNTFLLMPDNHFRWGESIQMESAVSRFGFYDLNDGTSVKIIPIYHPGSFRHTGNKEILKNHIYGETSAEQLEGRIQEVQNRLDKSTPNHIDAIKERLKDNGYANEADMLQKIYDWMKKEKRLFIYDEEKSKIKLNSDGKKAAWGYLIAEKLYGENGFIDSTILPRKNFDGFVLSYRDGAEVKAKNAVNKYNTRKDGQIVKGQTVFNKWCKIIDDAFDEMHISD